ncbi:MAG: outer membrane protein assembly factor BamA [Gammaproteobacteria bacterium]
MFHPQQTAGRGSRGLRHAVALALFAGAGGSLWTVGAGAQDAIAAEADFTVADLKVEGLQRIAEGTVFNYLPVAIGDRLNRTRIDEALRALYATGFFRNVELRRDGDVLVVVVQERPSIESFTIDGNKDIKTEDLQKSLRNVGLATGKTFDRSVLEDVTGYLTDQYYSRGKYAVKVDVKVDEVPGNKVKVAIKIKEGKRARIRQINIVGNTSFTDEEIREAFELKTPNWLSWYKQDDRYSKETMQGDLEKLRSFYMDRGYANFQAESTQVTIAPAKDDIFITMNVAEGDIYKVADVKIAGNLPVAESDLRNFVLVREGQTFNRKLMTQSQELMNLRLGADGYAFAKIEPVPTPDPEKKTVNITFFVEAGNRVYVRHVNFLGTDSINDVVMRREMRQLEGAWLSNSAVERSKERLQRLPFVEKVEFKNEPVAGTADLVDVNFTLKEGLPGQFGGGLGYSASQSLMLNGSFTHSNFLGTGQRVQAEINAGRYSKVYSFAHTDPYTTIDGIARTVSLVYRDVTQFVSAASDFSTKTATAALEYGYPISEFQSLRFGVALQRSELLTSSNGSAQQAIDWVRANGSPYERVEDFGFGFGPVRFYGNTFNSYELVGGWAYDTRNRSIFADRGMRHSLQLSYAVPGSTVQYASANYDYLQFVPLFGRFTLALSTELGYGQALGDTTALPPYKNFFGGGPDSVRGYRESRLGPKDTFGNPYGGNLKLVSRAELLLPTPEKFKTSVRVSLFYDIGNIFSTEGVKFVGRDGVTPVDYGFAFGRLRQSAGIAAQWLAPLGVFRFSLAVPLNAEKGDGVLFPDEKETFQFSIGNAF